MRVKDFFLDTPMESLTRGARVTEETVAFLEPETEKRTLYRIAEILRVTSYSGDAVYEPGRDYVLRDGALALTPGSRIPVMPLSLYYSCGAQELLRVRKPDGTESPCYFSEDGTMARFQIRVSYTHGDAWDGFRQPHTPGRFAKFLQKAEAGRDLTLLFYGDSITYGANASFMQGEPPHQPPYPMLFTDALARLYGYSVRFAPPEAAHAYPGPAPAFCEGRRGALTYVNTAVGGWNSADGVNGLGTHVEPQIKKYGCDLFLLAFGMNDGSRPPEETAANCEAVARRVLALRPDAAVLLVSTMLPNPDASNGWFASHPLQEPALLRLAASLREEGAACDVARVTSASEAVLRKKRFLDYTGNNINHPNDFFSRVYAQTLLETLVGYDGEAFAARASV